MAEDQVEEALFGLPEFDMCDKKTPDQLLEILDSTDRKSAQSTLKELQGALKALEANRYDGSNDLYGHVKNCMTRHKRVKEILELARCHLKDE